MFGFATDAAEPSIRNSNLFPVNANGEVRFLSVVSFMKCGSTFAPISICTHVCCSEEGIIFNGFQYICQLISKEDGYDCWRCFVTAKTVIVSSACNRYTEKIRIIVNGFDDSHQEYQELCILCRCFPDQEGLHLCLCSWTSCCVYRFR